MHALGLGTLFAYWAIFRKDVIYFFLKPYLILVAIVLYLTIHYTATLKNWDLEKNTIDAFLYAIMAVIIVNYAAQSKFIGVFKSILENKFIVYSGKISYGLYIFHLFIPDFFREHIAPKIGIEIANKYILFVIYYIITFAMAHISWRLIESPINNLKRYFPYQKSKN
jgi:peptidoglycan/LPS O-acetylase OafA/YrhL